MIHADDDDDGAEEDDDDDDDDDDDCVPCDPTCAGRTNRPC